MGICVHRSIKLLLDQCSTLSKSEKILLNYSSLVNSSLTVLLKIGCLNSDNLSAVQCVSFYMRYAQIVYLRRNLQVKKGKNVRIAVLGLINTQSCALSIDLSFDNTYCICKCVKLEQKTTIREQTNSNVTRCKSQTVAPHF